MATNSAINAIMGTIVINANVVDEDVNEVLIKLPSPVGLRFNGSKKFN